MRRAVLLVLVLAPALPGCGPAGRSSGPHVVASFYPVAEAVGRVGGGAVEVENLTPAGTEPHDLELSPRQVDHLEDADLVVYLGGGFQPAVEAVAERRDGPSLDLLDGPDPGRDPHVWLDPVRFATLVGRIADALAEVAPASLAVLAANAAAYRAELEALDADMRAGLAGCARRVIVTAHAAFGPLAARYGLTQEAIAGLSPEAEPDAGRLADLADAIRREGVTTVFYESLVSPRVAEALAREAGVDAAVLDPVEGLSREAVDAGKDYAAVMRDNLAALRTALACP